MKLGAVKTQPAEIDWAAEFGEDEDEFTVEETPEEDVEVEILLKENRQKGRASQNGDEQDKKQQPQPSYSIRNGDMKLTSALAVPAKSAMSIGRAGGASTTTSNDAVSTTSSAASSSSSYSMDGSEARYAAPMPRIDLDTHQVVEPSPYGAFIEIRTMAATIKIIALVHLVRASPLQSIYAFHPSIY